MPFHSASHHDQNFVLSAERGPEHRVSVQDFGREQASEVLGLKQALQCTHTPVLCPGRPVRALAQESLLSSEVKGAGKL